MAFNNITAWAAVLCDMRMWYSMRLEDGRCGCGHFCLFIPRR